MPEYDPVAKISIIPRGQAGGLTFFAPSEERLESGLYSRSYLENQMAVALGGRLVVQHTYLPTSICLHSLAKLKLQESLKFHCVKMPIQIQSYSDGVHLKLLKNANSANQKLSKALL